MPTGTILLNQCRILSLLNPFVDHGQPSALPKPPKFSTNQPILVYSFVECYWIRYGFKYPFVKSYIVQDLPELKLNTIVIRYILSSNQARLAMPFRISLYIQSPMCCTEQAHGDYMLLNS